MPAALAPEELELVVPEKVTNPTQVSTNPYGIEIFHAIHRGNIFAVAEDIQETCVKVFNYIAEFAVSKPTVAWAD